ncbi:hypothetical protein D3C75_802780 [compost metagenome]
MYPPSAAKVAEGAAEITRDISRPSPEEQPGFAAFSLRFPQVQPKFAVRQTGKAADGSKTYLLELDPAALAGVHDCFLRIDFAGDRADFLINGEKAADWFYNGETWEIGLRRFANQLPGAELKITVYPLHQSDPVYMDVPPRFPEDGSPLCALVQAEAVTEYMAALELRPQ